MRSASITRHRPAFAIGTFLVLATTAIAGCGSSAAGTTRDSATVRIGVLNGSDNGLALAKADRSLDREVKAAGGTIEYAGPFPAFAPAAEAIKAGAVDITVGGLLSWVGGLAANPDLVVFAHSLDVGSSSGIVATKNSGIRTVADLVGKRVAVNKAGTGEYLLLKALHKAGIDDSKVTRVYLPVTDGATAFQSGKVDAWASWGTFFATAATSPGATVVATGDDVDSHNDTVYVVTRKFLQAHPGVVKAVFKALSENAKTVAANPTVLENVWKSQNLPNPTIDFLKKVRAPTVDNVTPAVQVAFQKEADFWSDEKVIPTKVQVKSSATDLGSP